MGRAAAANGNGRPVLPPGVHTPMRRYQQPPPRRRSTLALIGRVVLWLLVAVLVVASGLAGGAYLYFHQSVAAVVSQTPELKPVARKLHVTLPNKPSIALVVGYDKRRGADAKLDFSSTRSDTIMLIRADPGQNTISLLSFPRDLEVPIYCPNHAVFTDRINAAYGTCGPEGTVSTVEKLTGLTPNYLITVDFHGFKEIVNKLGGVYLQVDRRYINTHGGPGGYATINLDPGYQKLDGQQALDFVRYRHTDSDLYRLARQQLFVQALKQRIESGFSPFTLPKIVGAVTHSVKVVGSGDISGNTVLSYALFAYHLPQGHLFRAKIDNLVGYDTLTAPISSIEQAVHDFTNPDVQAPERANAAALGIKHRQARQLKPAEIKLLVLNGTTVPGLARDTSYKLTLRGYRTLELPNQQPANAPASTYYQTQVYYDPGNADGRAAAKQVAALVPGSVVAEMPPEIQTPYALETHADVVVVLGSTFNGELTPPPSVEQTPKHAPPVVSTDPGMTLSQVADAQRRLPFPAMVPHVVAQGSQLSTLEGVRVYKPAAHQKAVVLTFAWGDFGGEYWQVEETDWSGAPVLGKPTATHTFNGRQFDFYYNGAHLHMVVLRTPKATYWVVNTLLDKLSNETMIAIARGLEPLGK